MTGARWDAGQAWADFRATWKKGLLFLVLACVVGYLVGHFIVEPLAEALTN